MMAEIIICRHGNTFDPGDVITRVGGRTDLPLSRSGVVQAEALAAHFRDQAPMTRAFSSPLRRTTQTLQTILSAQDNPPEIESRSFLTELDYGVDENCPEGQVVARIGEDALRAWETDAVLPDGWQLDIDALVESWRAFLTEQAALPGRTLVMTSNGVARFVFKALGEEPGARRIKLKTGAYGVLEPGAEGYRVAEWNIRP